MKAPDEYFELASLSLNNSTTREYYRSQPRGPRTVLQHDRPFAFHEKDLDHDLEEFIVSWATEYPINEPIRLVVHLQMILPGTDTHAVIERAVHNYFAYKTDLNHREFRNLLREGRISLVIGLSFLALCLSGAEVLAGLEVPGTKVLQESLTICGWVAMWHPMDTFTDAFDAGWQPSPDPFFTAVATFEALPGGKTKYTARALHWTAANREKHEQMGFHQGWGESLDRLVALVTKS